MRARAPIPDLMRSPEKRRLDPRAWQIRTGEIPVSGRAQVRRLVAGRRRAHPARGETDPRTQRDEADRRRLGDAERDRRAHRARRRGGVATRLARRLDRVARSPRRHRERIARRCIFRTRVARQALRRTRRTPACDQRARQLAARHRRCDQRTGRSVVGVPGPRASGRRRLRAAGCARRADRASRRTRRHRRLESDRGAPVALARTTRATTIHCHGLRREDGRRKIHRAWPQRQRLFRRHLRCTVRCAGTAHLDRRRRRAQRRSARGTRSRHARGDELRGSLRTGLLRREGDPSADDGAGDRTRIADLHPQHVQARASGHAHRRAKATPADRSRVSRSRTTWR